MPKYLAFSTNSIGIPSYFNIKSSTFNDFNWALLPTSITLDYVEVIPLFPINAQLLWSLYVGKWSNFRNKNSVIGSLNVYLMSFNADFLKCPRCYTYIHVYIHEKLIWKWCSNCNKKKHFSTSQLVNALTHWGRVTHICVSKLTIIGWENGLSPRWHQAIIWTNAGMLLLECYYSKP